MAWLEEHPTSGHFKICFRWGGRKLKKTVKTTVRKEAENESERVGVENSHNEDSKDQERNHAFLIACKGPEGKEIDTGWPGPKGVIP